MSHYLTQPEEVDFVLMAMERYGMEIDMPARQESCMYFDCPDAPYTVQPESCGNRVNPAK